MSREFADGAIVQPSLDWDSRPCIPCDGTGCVDPITVRAPFGRTGVARMTCPICNGAGKVRANLRPWGRLLHRGDDPRALATRELYEDLPSKAFPRIFWRVEWSDGTQSWVEEKNLEVIAGPETSKDSAPT